MKIKALFEKYKDFIMEVIHFGIVGVMNTLLGYLIMSGLYNLAHWNYWVSSGTSYFIGSVFSYYMNGNGFHGGLPSILWSAMGWLTGLQGRSSAICWPHSRRWWWIMWR